MKQTALFHCQRCEYTTTNGGELAIVALPAVTGRAMNGPRPVSRMAICIQCQTELAGFMQHRNNEPRHARQHVKPRDLLNDRQLSHLVNNAHAAAFELELQAQRRARGEV